MNGPQEAPACTRPEMEPLLSGNHLSAVGRQAVFTTIPVPLSSWARVFVRPRTLLTKYPERLDMTAAICYNM